VTCGGENPAYGERRRATRYRQSALEKVATFNDFNEGNDPHQERDYGSFDHTDREFWFKIDYCDFEIGDGFPRSG
jgi:hypothetical protein